jgi:hypothetical protein
LFKIKLQKNDVFYECLSENCEQMFKNTRDRFNHMISVHNFHKNDLLEFEVEFDNLSKSNLLRSGNVPNNICFGENSQLAFSERKIKTAKRKK